jgi:hypothetical protein|tara:strand:+ start:328 stop:756 length:429 start_codon:yes stop_codon:yes gene_type:complete
VLSRLHILLAALWWGGTTALAFVAVPVLFMHFDTPAVAGAAAAKLFAAQSVLTVVLTVAALVLILASRQDQAGKSTWLLWGGGALLAISNQWWVAPLIVSARATGGNLALWHGLGSSLIVAQWLLALATLWLLTTPHKLKPN